MRRMGGDRQIATGELVLALGAGLDALEPALDGEVDRLVIADLEMQEGMLLDAAPEDLAAVAQAAQKIAHAAMKAFSADGITIQQFNEGAGGQVVFHLHVHVIPRKAGVAMKPPASEKEKPEVLSGNALKLAAALKG